MKDDAIINALGVAHLAAMCGREESSVRNWKARGIPWRWRGKVAEIAKRRGLKLPADFMTRENKNV